jgi:glyoxylase-like metal-dependent hydrolase (beta-lactamase superfamily II)
MSLTEFRINDDLSVYSSSKNNSNSTVYRYEDNLLIVDTFLYAADNQELLSIVKGYNYEHRFIINTHWHSDHCYGNRFFTGPKTKVIAHGESAETLSSERKMISAGKKFRFSAKVVPAPDITITEPFSVLPNVSIIPAPGHTEDSMIVYLSSEGTVIAGDSVLSSDKDYYLLPYFYWGDIDDLIATLKAIRKLNPQTIVPGHGNLTNQDKIDYDLVYLVKLKKEFGLFCKDDQYLHSLLEEEKNNHNRQSNLDSVINYVGNKLPLEMFLSEELFNKTGIKEIHTLNLRNIINNEFFV